jgi:transcriptional regulator of arginine metabolism
VSPKTRRERELAILRILVDREVHTQGELVAELQGRGFVVTQATVSRDIRRLGILKLPSPDGAPRYVSPDEDHLSRNGSGDDGTRAREQLAAAVRESVLEVDSGEALLAVRTPPGLANAVAVTLDRARIPEIVATLAGDDTIFVLMRNAADRRKIRRLLEGYL